MDRTGLTVFVLSLTQLLLAVPSWYIVISPKISICSLKTAVVFVSSVLKSMHHAFKLSQKPHMSHLLVDDVPLTPLAFVE